MEALLPFVVLLFIVLSVIGWIKLGNFANPITLFCGVWALILLLYSLHLYGLYYASEDVLVSCILGVVSFFFGGMLKAGKLRANKRTVDVAITKGQVNYMILSIFNTISFVFLLYFGVRSIYMLLSGYDFSYIRQMYMNEEGDSIGASKLTSYIMSFFIWPWNYTIIPLSVILFLNDRKSVVEDRTFMITTLLNVILFIIVTAGRISIVYYLMYFVLVIILGRRKNVLSKKQKTFVIVFALIGYAAISYISYSRRSSPLEKNAYLYICGCIPFFTDRLQKFKLSSGQFTYGFASLHGIIMLLIIPFGKIFGYPELYKISIENSYVQDRIYIGNKTSFNAFTSLFYSFYIDGGIILVVIFSFCFGYYCVSKYIKLIKYQTVYNLLVYLLVAFGVLFSMVRFQFITFRYFGAFLYAWLCFRNINKRISD